MTPAAALRLLRESRDADSSAPTWADNGRTVRRLATLAGVRVEYVTVNLATLTTTRHTVEPGEGVTG